MDILNRNVIFITTTEEDKKAPFVEDFINRNPLNHGGTFCYSPDCLFSDAEFSYLGLVTHFVIVEGDDSGLNKEVLDFIRGVSTVTKSFFISLNKREEYSRLEEYLDSTESNIPPARTSEKARFCLLAKGFTSTPESLFTAVKTGKESLLSLFFMSGISPDCTNSDGLPLIIWLVRHKFYKLLPVVIRAGADVNIVSPDRGYSALMECTMDRQTDSVRLLLEAGADPDIVGKDGQSALILAVCNNDRDITSLLLKYNANPDIPDKMGMTAGGYAKLFNKTDIVMQFA